MGKAWCWLLLLLVATPVLAAPPATPTGFTVEPRNSGVYFTWNAVSNVTQFVLQRKEGNGAYSTVAYYLPYQTSSEHFISGGNGKTYTFRMRAFNSDGSSAYSSEVSAMPRLQTPHAFTASAREGAVYFEWPAIPYPVGYRIKMGTESGSYSTEVNLDGQWTTSYTWSNLTPGVTYYFVLEARAAISSGDSLPTPERSAIPYGTPGSAPANLIATPGNGQVDLNWSSVPAATSYRVKRSTSSGGPYTQIATPSSTSYTNTGLTNGVTYYYVVSAANSYGEGSNSSQISATPQIPAPGTPGAPSISNIATTSLSSTAPILPANATSLTLQKKLASQDDSFYANVATGLGALATTNVTGLTAETQYTFRYVAVGDGGSTAGSGVNATTLEAAPSAPTMLSALAGNGVVDLSWQAANGAVTYRVERSTVTEGPYSLVADDIDELTYSDTTVTNGTTYYYVIRGVNGGGNGPASNEASATPQVPAPAAPGAPSFSDIAQTSVKVTAPALPSGAASLTLQKKLASEPDGSYANVDTGLEGEDESLADLLTANTTYSFRYVAVNAGGSTVGTSANVTTLPNAPAAPANLVATPGDGEVDLTWEASSGAVTYAVHRSTIEGGPYTEIEDGLTATSFNDDDVTNGTTYYYVVTAINPGGSSANSGEASALPQVAAPDAPSAPSFSSITNTSVAVTMPALPARAESLILQRKATGTDDSTYIEVDDELEAEEVVPVTGLSAATGYTFRVIAVNAGGSTVGTSAGMTTLPNAPAAPENLTATAGNARVDLAWDAVSGATSYTIKRSLVADGPYSTIKSNHTETTYEDIALPNGVTQYYVVVAVNSGGNSANSNEASATPQVPAPAAPDAPSFSDITQTSVKVTAPELPEGATSLTLQKKLASEQNSAYSNVDTGLEGEEETLALLLTANTEYSFRYVAVNAGGSTVGTHANVTTLPNAPVAPQDLVAIGGDGEVALTWEASAGAVSYTVHYGTTLGGPYTEQESAGANTQYTHTPATNGTTYYYVVTATNTGGTSGNSNEASATPQVPAPAAPGVPSFNDITQTSVKVTAPALPSGASSLTLQKKLASEPDGSYANVATGLAGAAETTANTLTASTEYSFRYVAVNAGGSTAGTAANATTLPNAPAAPEDLVATPGDAQVDLTWEASAGAVSYTVHYGVTEGGPYTEQESAGANTGFTHTPATNGTTYYYVVTATNTGGTSAPSDEASATPQAPAPAAPGAPIFSDITQTSVKVTAPELPEGATSLTLQKKLASEPDSSYSNVDTGLEGEEETVALLLTANTQYSFRYVAVNAGGNTTGTGANITTLPNAPAAPQDLVATAGDGEVALAWEASAGTVSYSVHRSTTPGGPYTEIEDGLTTTSFNDTNVTNGTTYFYVVTAINTGGSSANSNEASDTPQVAAPAAPDAPAFGNITNTGVSVTLPVLPAGADSLTLQRKETGADDSTYIEVDDELAGGSVVPVTGLTAATEYTFRVVAVNAGGSTVGDPADMITLPNAPAAPEDLEATPGDGRVDLTWEASAGAVSYTLYSSTTEGGPYAEVQAGLTTTSYTHLNLTNGTEYFYVVRAVNTGGSSADSDEASATPQVAAPAAPDVPSFSNITSTGVSVTMPALPARATSLILQRKEKGAGDNTYVEVGTNPQPETVVSGGTLTPSTEYTFRVVAVNAGGNTPGDPADMETLPNAPGAPQNVLATGGNQQVALTWDAVSGATSYQVQYATVTQGPYTLADGNVTTNSFTHTGLTNGTTYFYIVTASNTGGTSAPSDEVSATPTVAAPETPGAPTFSEIASESVKVHMPTLPVGATSFTLEQKLDGEGDETYITRQTGLGSGGTFVADELEPATTYAFRVIAIGPGGSTAGPHATVETTSGDPDPDPDPQLLADLLVRGANDVEYIGDGLYSTAGAGQEKTQTVELDETAIYHVQIQNDSAQSGSFVLSGNAALTGWTVKYYDALTGGTDITADITGLNGWSTGTLAEDGTRELRIEVTPGETVVDDATLETVISVASAGNAIDAVKMSTKKEAPPTLGQPMPPTFSEVTTTSMRVHLPALPTLATTLHLQQKVTGAGDETYITYNDVTPEGSLVVSELTPFTSYTFRVVAAGVEAQTESEPALQSTLDIERQADLLVRKLNETVYSGDNLYNATGVGQEKTLIVQTDEKATYEIKVQNDADSAGSFILTAPAGGNGWTVQYFDSLTEGTDITTQITGEDGWSTGALAIGASREIRIEVTPDETIAAGAQKELLVTASSAEIIQDVVKLNTIRQPLPAQPDLSIRVLPREEEFLTVEEAAEKGVNSFNQSINVIRSEQKLPLLTYVGDERKLAVTVKNKGTVPTVYKITLPQNLTSYQVQLYSALENGVDISSEALSTEGWLTPVINPQESITLKLIVKALNNSTLSYEAIVNAEVETLYDGVAADISLQYIAKLQYSHDAGENWSDTGSTPIEVVQGTPFLARAIKGNTAVGWPTYPEQKPVWTNVAKSNYKNVGETVSFIFSTATGAQQTNEIIAECGNNVSAQVRVITFASIVAWAEEDSIMAFDNSPPEIPATTQIMAHVTDWNGNPLPNITIRFASSLGQINGSGTTDDEAITNANGYASVTLHAGAAGTAALTAAIVVPNATPQTMVADEPAKVEIIFD